MERKANVNETQKKIAATGVNPNENLGWLWDEYSACERKPNVNELKAYARSAKIESGNSAKEMALAQARGLVQFASQLGENDAIYTVPMLQTAERFLHYTKSGEGDKRVFPLQTILSFPRRYETHEPIDWLHAARKSCELAGFPDALDADDGIKNAFLVCRSHEDLNSYEQGGPGAYNEILGIVLNALDTDPLFAWTCEQACLLYAYWLKHPEDHDRITRYVRCGRLEIMAPWHLFYGTFEHGETLIENIRLAQEWVRNTFGVSCATLCRNDSCAQPDQLPQIMNMLGVENIAGILRHCPVSESEFIWRDGNGNEIFFYRQHRWYNGLNPNSAKFPVATDQMEAILQIQRWIRRMEGKAGFRHIHIPINGDFAFPKPETTQVVQFWNEHLLKKTGYRLILSTYSQFIAAVKHEAKRAGRSFPIVRGGDFHNTWWNSCTVLNPEHAVRMRDTEQCLLHAERLAAMVASVDAPYPTDALARAWMQLTRLFFHDCLCGLEIHYLRMGRIRGLASLVREKSLAWLSRRIRHAQGQTHVINTLPWARNDIACVSLPPETESLLDIDTNEMCPVQKIGRADNGTECLFVTEPGRVPALGYKTLEIARGPSAPQTMVVSENEIRNKHYRIVLTDVEHGCFGVISRKTERCLIEAGCLVSYQMDIDQSMRQSFWPDQETVILQRPICGKRSIIEQGPVRVRVRWSMRLVHVQLSITLTVYAQNRRLEIAVETEPDAPGMLYDDYHSVMVACRCPEPGDWIHANPLSRIRRRASHDHDDLMDFQIAREFVASMGIGGGVAMFNRGSQITRVFMNEIQWWIGRYGGGKSYAHTPEIVHHWLKIWPWRLEAALLPVESNDMQYIHREAEAFQYPLLQCGGGETGEMEHTWSALPGELPAGLFMGRMWRENGTTHARIVNISDNAIAVTIKNKAIRFSPGEIKTIPFDC
jgi:hypothetical protein